MGVQDNQALPLDEFQILRGSELLVFETAAQKGAGHGHFDAVKCKSSLDCTEQV